MRQHQRFLRIGTTLAAAWLMAGLAACYVPDRTAHATLVVSAGGTYSFQGQPVTLEQLPATASAAVRAAPTLLVEIQAAPEAGVDAVRVAVEALERAHVRVAFAGATAAAGSTPAK